MVNDTVVKTRKTVKYGVTHLLHRVLSEFGETLKRAKKPIISSQISKQSTLDIYTLFVVLPYDTFEFRYNLRVETYKDKNVSDSKRETLTVIFNNGGVLDLTSKLEHFRSLKNSRLLPAHSLVIEMVIFSFSGVNLEYTTAIEANERTKGKWNYGKIIENFQKSLGATQHGATTIHCELEEDTALVYIEAYDDIRYKSPLRQYSFEVPKSSTSKHVEEVAQKEYQNFFKPKA